MDAKTPIDMNLIERKLVPTDNKCAICLESLESGCVYKLECGHSFHVNCIMENFRHRPACPLCRDEGLCEGLNPSWRTMKAIFQLKKNIARRKDAPKQLKTLVKRYMKKKNRLKERTKEYTAWKKSEEGKEYARLHKISNRHIRRTRGQYYFGRLSTRSVEAQIAMYPIRPMIMRIKK